MRAAVPMVGLFVLLGAGCARPIAPPRAVVAAPPTETDQGWDELFDGHSERADARFDRALAGDAADPRARFGKATVAFERGDSAAALEQYVAVAEVAARDPAHGSGPAGPAWAGVLAPMAIARAEALLDEVPAGAAATAKWEDRLIAVARQPLPWEARVELARAVDRIARRRGDPRLRDDLGRAAGCARAVFLTGSAGRLPHLDLDRAEPGTAVATTAGGADTWRPLATVGCHVVVPSWDGRAGVPILKTAVTVAAGLHDVVIDFPGEARAAIDGGPLWRHGEELRYGPRVSRRVVALAAGTHVIEVRVESTGAKADLGLWVLGQGGAGVRFVDARRLTVTAAPVPDGEVARGLEEAARAAPVRDGPPGQSWGGLSVFARAFVADRLGEIDRALVLAEELGRLRRFAPGLTLAAAIARGDPTRPAGFARDAGRALLRRATAVEPGLARPWRTLAAIEIEAEHPRDAIDYAREAARAAPRWWPPELTMANALRARGLERDADRALDRAAEKAGPVAGAPCRVVEALLARAEERRDLRSQDELIDRRSRCDPDSGAAIDRMRARGDLAGARDALRQAVALDPDREDLRIDLANVLLAGGGAAEAAKVLAALAAEEPRDATLRVRLADAQAAAGDQDAARAALVTALQQRPDLADVRRAARAVGLPLPLDGLRLDAKQVISDFRASGQRYAAPAVMVLDRTVHRIFPDGAQLILTHNIVAVQSKDGIDRWGEVAVPSGAEILALRTHKSDGTTREPEEIAGKDAVSAPDLAVGDFVEWETLEAKGPSDAFPPGPLPGSPAGFLGDRFYFQSFDAPLDRSEYVVVTPPGLKLDADRRAGAPAPSTDVDVDGAGQPIQLTTFAARHARQLFAERSSVPAVEYVPSVRVSSRLSWDGWIRFLREQIYGTWRASPAIRRLATQIRTETDGAPTAARAAAQAAAIVRWVTDNIEAAEDLRDPASFTLARGRGNRLALMLALAHELAVPAEPQLARSRLLAETDGPLVPEEVDDFGDPLVGFDVGGDSRAVVFVDPRLRHAPFGYLAPGLDGARTLSLASGKFGVAHSRGSADQRIIDMTIDLDERGGGSAHATEELTGWPALEWAELLDRFGSDETKLRQDFEQRVLGVQFPGAHLDDLQVEVAPVKSAKPAKPEKSGGDGKVRVRYSFRSPQLAAVTDQEIKLLPTFFRSQPGRRYAAEPRRATTLMMGFDVPFRLTATVVLPPSAEVVDAAAPHEGVIARKGAYRFFEERSARTARPGSPGVLLLRRESALPLLRVTPTEYAGVAADLRRVDGLEQQEIRIRLRRGTAARGAGAP